MGLAHPTEGEASADQGQPQEQKKLQQAMLRKRKAAPKHRVRMR
jgi:hypothetical protein